MQRSKISRSRAEASAHEIVHSLGQNDAARRCMLLQSCGEVHTVAEHVELSRNDVCDMHGNAERDRWHRIIGALRLHRPLDLLRPLNRVESTRKFGQNSITCRLHDLAAVANCLGTDDLVENGHPALMGSRFVACHQDRVADNVNEGDCRQPTVHARGVFAVGRGTWHVDFAPHATVTRNYQLCTPRFVYYAPPDCKGPVLTLPRATAATPMVCRATSGSDRQ